MSFVKRCGPCGGSGYIGDDRHDICVVCRGTGGLRLDGEQNQWQRCNPCGGSGYIGSNRKDVCSACDGCGKLIKP